MSDNEAKAQALVQEAEKKLNKSKGFLGNLFGYELHMKFFVTSMTHANFIFIFLTLSWYEL